MEPTATEIINALARYFVCDYDAVEGALGKLIDDFDPSQRRWIVRHNEAEENRK